MKRKLLLTRPLNLPLHPDVELKKAFDVTLARNDTEKELASLVGDVDVIVAHGTSISERIIHSAPNLKLISTPQVGFDKIDVSSASKFGVAVIAATGLSPITVAEFTIGLMIAMARRIVKSSFDLRLRKDWAARTPYVKSSLDMGTDLHGATVGLVGLGSIGSSVAALCRQAFSARILGYDPFVSLEQMTSLGVDKRENLLHMAREVDFLSLHLALTDHTRHLINDTVLREMKPTAYLINCARGEIVDEKALETALNEQWIAGAALDVLENEPLNPENPLLTMQNVIVTPHIAGVTVQSSVLRGEELVRRIIDAFSGNKPDGLVNPDVWPIFLRKIK